MPVDAWCYAGTMEKCSRFNNGRDYQESLFSDLKQRLRNIEASPAGVIYLLTDGPGGKLIKVLPNK